MGDSTAHFFKKKKKEKMIWAYCISLFIINSFLVLQDLLLPATSLQYFKY